MYRIVKITDRNGNDKGEVVDELRRVHPDLLGEIINEELLDSTLFLSCLCFLWHDDTNKILRTSCVLEVEKDLYSMIVTTMNSIYYFEKVTDEYKV